LGHRELKDQGVAVLLKGLAQDSHGRCVVTSRYSVPDLRAFWQTTAPEVKLLCLSRDTGVHLPKTLGVGGTAARVHPRPHRTADRAGERRLGILSYRSRNR